MSTPTGRLQDSAVRQGHYYQVLAILGAIGVAIAAVEFYEVRELVAALIIFSLLFCAIGMALAIGVLIQGVAFKGLNHLESRVSYARAHHRPQMPQ